MTISYEIALEMTIKFEKIFPKIYNKEMNTFLRNTVSKLYNAVSAPVTATRDSLAERLQSVRYSVSSLHNRMVENMGYGQETLKDIVGKEAEEKEQQQEIEEDVDLTSDEHERALNGAYRSFMMPGKSKTRCW